MDGNSINPRKITSEGLIVDCRGIYQTALGNAERIRVFSYNYQPLSVEAAWGAAMEIFPGKWLMQVHRVKRPGRYVYHFYVFDKEPGGFDPDLSDEGD